MDNSKKIILDLCGGSGSWSQPYRDAGYDVKIITLPKYDVRDFALLPGDEIYGILAAPPLYGVLNSQESQSEKRLQYRHGDSECLLADYKFLSAEILGLRKSRRLPDCSYRESKVQLSALVVRRRVVKTYNVVGQFQYA